MLLAIEGNLILRLLIVNYYILNWYASIFLLIFPLYIWFYTPLRWRNILLIAWVAKMVAAIFLGLIYSEYYGGGDTYSLFEDGKKLYAIAKRDFTAYFHIVTHVLQGKPISSIYGLGNVNPRAVLMALYNSLLIFFTGGNYWLTALLSSSINFLATAKFLLQLEKQYQLKPIKLSIAFFFFPSILLWTSGLLKENLLLTGLCIILTVYLKMLDTKPSQIKFSRRILYLLILFIVLFFLYRLKYYYTAIFAPLLLAHWVAVKGAPLLGSFINKWQFHCSKLAIQYFLFITVFSLSVSIATLSHPNLHLANILQAIVTNHTKMAGESMHQYNLIVFNDLQPEISSFIKNLPQAFIEGLFRPYLWEKGNVLKKLAAVENLCLLFLVLFSLLQFKKRKQYIKTLQLETLFIIFYVLIMCTLLAFATPNLGTLVRYKVGYLPFLLLLILPNSYSYFYKGKRL